MSVAKPKVVENIIMKSLTKIPVILSVGWENKQFEHYHVNKLGHNRSHTLLGIISMNRSQQIILLLLPSK